MSQLGPASENFVKQEWVSRILPAYRRTFPNGDFPEELTVLEGNYFDGFGSPGLVAVDGAVVAETNSAVRLFALAHETGHCVVYQECERLGLTTPNTDTGENKKKHESLADLIAMRVLRERLPSTADDVIAAFPTIAKKLGAADSEHPSGQERTQLMQRYVNGASWETLLNAVVAGVPLPTP